MKVEPLQPLELGSTTGKTTPHQTTLSQQEISKMWETTQKWIALLSVLGAVAIDGLVVILCIVLNRDITASQALLLGFINSTSASVVSFYFTRTNHTKIGGVGEQPLPQPYEGR